MGDQDEEIPKASTEAIEFCKNIRAEDIETSIFKDELVNVSDDGKTLGEMTISIERVSHAGEVALLIHASSQGKVEDIPTGTTLTAYVKPDLTVLEQHHQEHIKIPNHELQKTTSMKRDEKNNAFFVSRQVNQGTESRSYSYSYSLEAVQGLVTEGSNLLLQRLLAKMEVQEFENLVFLTVDAESGGLFPTSYKSLPERMQKVGKNEVSVLGIERSVISASDLPCTWQSFFMDDGHLTMRVQVGSPNVLTIETVPHRIEKEEYEEKPIFGKKTLNWETDAELTSMFLERKEALKADHFAYLQEHPDATSLLADFLQFVLLRKPDDIVKFAGDYFSSFSANLPESSSYKHSSSP